MAVVGIVPAAGYATRLQPLEGSKELLEVAGKPVMDHVLERMLAAGASELRIVTRPEKHDVIEHAATLGAAVVTAYPATTSASFAAGLTGLAAEDIVLLGWPDTIWEPFEGFLPLVGAVEAGADLALGLFRIDASDLTRSDVIRFDAAGDLVAIEIKPRRAAVRLDLGLCRRPLQGPSSARDVRVAGRAFRRNGSRGQARGKRPPLRLLARHRHAGRARSAGRPASLRQPAAPPLCCRTAQSYGIWFSKGSSRSDSEGSCACVQQFATSDDGACMPLNPLQTPGGITTRAWSSGPRNTSISVPCVSEPSRSSKSTSLILPCTHA